MKNWKTTLAGIAAIIGGVFLILSDKTGEGVTAITLGVGLIAAKDAGNNNSANTTTGQGS